LRLVTFYKNKQKQIGLLLGQNVINIPVAAKQYRLSALPGSMREFLMMGPPAMTIAKTILKRVQDDMTARRKVSCLIPLSQIKLGPPVDVPEKIICIGQNYIDHCREQNVPPPEKPILFAKFINALNGPCGDIRIPTVSDKIDFEAELAVVIGKKAFQVSREKAMQYVAGYMVLNDITARDIQKSDGQWVRGKTSDTFAPCGPALVTKDEIKNPGQLKIQLNLNGQIMQDSSTSNLIFDIPYLIWFITQNITLVPGDIISTGTPPGVGFARKPPVFLKKDDLIETTIESIGTLVNKVI
jgi:2-keto-4-pentenoate hydratase/2-oxohepta-3-ene-1,7-dioic acid hydratase in catechol pathway